MSKIAFTWYWNPQSVIWCSLYYSTKLLNLLVKDHYLVDIYQSLKVVSKCELNSAFVISVINFVYINILILILINMKIEKNNDT